MRKKPDHSSKGTLLCIGLRLGEHSAGFKSCLVPLFWNRISSWRIISVFGALPGIILSVLFWDSAHVGPCRFQTRRRSAFQSRVEQSWCLTPCWALTPLISTPGSVGRYVFVLWGMLVSISTHGSSDAAVADLMKYFAWLKSGSIVDNNGIP